MSPFFHRLRRQRLAWWMRLIRRRHGSWATFLGRREEYRRCASPRHQRASIRPLRAQDLPDIKKIIIEQLRNLSFFS